MIQEKELAYLKTTGEPCAVLELDRDADDKELAIIRRPWGGSQNGLQHAVETVFVWELETRGDHLKRLAERKREEMEIDRSLFSSIMGPGAPVVDEEDEGLGALSVN